MADVTNAGTAAFPVEAPATEIKEIPTEWFVSAARWGEGYHVTNDVVVIGAGGVGARLVPLLVKQLAGRDNLFVVDDDIVETRNLLRQHFTAADVGRPKAQLVAERAAAINAQPRVGIYYAVGRVSADNPHSGVLLCPRRDHTLARALYGADFNLTDPNTIRLLVVISCVDTIVARKSIQQWLTVSAGGYHSYVWIDCGNADKSGQALYAMIIPGTGPLQQRGTPRVRYDGKWDGFKFLCPEFLNQKDEEVVGDACAARIDTQTVTANNWAATCAATLADPLLAQRPFSLAGMMFSTAGSLRTSYFTGTGVSQPLF